MDAPLADADVEEISAEEAFAILCNETRMAVPWTLRETEGPVPFTDLRRRVAPDDRGKFSYHLDRLVEAHGWAVSVAEAELGGARVEVSGVRIG